MQPPANLKNERQRYCGVISKSDARGGKTRSGVLAVREPVEECAVSDESLFPEVEKIISVLQSSVRQDIVILFIPSHDKKKKEIKNQDVWAGEAMVLFKDLYRGATAFEAFAGIYLTDKGETLNDKPILIESYVSRESLEDKRRLNQLVAFMKRMGRETKQAAVAVVINDVFHEITEF
jgi:hypothetical protein